ncbi:hypothetical protein KAR91_20105 [Candidatus Pacearchaeota archaeon]|nr:hypothetical protein [Candidatus Pacearchaeota archaeon]
MILDIKHSTNWETIPSDQGILNSISNQKYMTITRLLPIGTKVKYHHPHFDKPLFIGVVSFVTEDGESIAYGS